MCTDRLTLPAVDHEIFFSTDKISVIELTVEMKLLPSSACARSDVLGTDNKYFFAGKTR
jgi:hypothetical protein